MTQLQQITFTSKTKLKQIKRNATRDSCIHYVRCATRIGNAREHKNEPVCASFQIYFITFLSQDMITGSSKWLHLHVNINNLAFTELIIKINLSG